MDEALKYWAENIQSAVVNKETFLERVSNGIDYKTALTEFFVEINTEDEVEDEIEENLEDFEQDEDEGSYFDELVGEVEENGEDLELFGEKIKAPFGA